MYSILHRIGSIMFFSLHFSPSIANPNENISFPFMCRLVFVEVHFKSPRNCVPTWNRCHRYRSIWYGIQIHRKTRWKTIMNIKVLNLSTAKLITNSTYICLLCVNASLSMAEIPLTIYHHSLIWYDCRCCLLLGTVVVTSDGGSDDAANPMYVPFVFDICIYRLFSFACSLDWCDQFK